MSKDRRVSRYGRPHDWVATPKGAGFTAAAQRLTDPLRPRSPVARPGAPSLRVTLCQHTAHQSGWESAPNSPRWIPPGPPCREATMTRKITLVAGVLAL